MNSDLILYQSEDGEIHVNVQLEDETTWLTQSTCKDFLVVRQEGGRQVSRNLKHYNLDAIIAVAYRIDAAKATQFRIWGEGYISKKQVGKKPKSVYNIFNKTQFIESNVDKIFKKLSMGM